MAAALAVTGLVHVLLASTYGAGSALVGVAFVVGGVTSFVAAAGLLYRDSAIAWNLAAAVSAGMLAGLLVSATVGLFGIVTAQLGAAEITALATEAFVLAAWAVRIRRF